MTGKPGLIDSNILVYAFDRDEAEKHENAKAFLKEAYKDRAFTVSIQNLAEFHSASTGKIERTLSPEYSAEIILEFAAAFEVIKYDEKTIVDAIKTQILYNIHFWDALIASTMQENNVKTIYTENTKDFGKIPWVKAINPLKK